MLGAVIVSRARYRLQLEAWASPSIRDGARVGVRLVILKGYRASGVKLAPVSETVRTVEIDEQSKRPRVVLQGPEGEVCTPKHRPTVQSSVSRYDPPVGICPLEDVGVGVELHGDGGCGSRRVSAEMREARRTYSVSPMPASSRPVEMRSKQLPTGIPLYSSTSLTFKEQSTCSITRESRPSLEPSRSALRESWPGPSAMGDWIGEAEPHCACRLQFCT